MLFLQAEISLPKSGTFIKVLNAMVNQTFSHK